MKRIVGVLFGATVVVSACGGGSSSALSKDDFLSKGNAICKTGSAAIDAAGNSVFSGTASPDPATVRKFFNDTLVPNVKKQIDDIDALKPPSDLQSAVDKLVKDAKARLSQLQDQVSKDPSILFSSEDPFADINKEATAIGLTACASSGSGGSASSVSSS